MEIRAMAQEEQKYTYRQSMQIQGQTGSIRYLRGDFGSRGNEFHTTWNDHRQSLKTEEFQAEFDDVINALRSKEYGLFLGGGQEPDERLCGEVPGQRIFRELRHGVRLPCGHRETRLSDTVQPRKRGL